MSLISELSSLKRRANLFHASIETQIQHMMIDLGEVESLDEDGVQNLKDEINALDFRWNETHENLLRCIHDSANDINRTLINTVLKIREIQAYSHKQLEKAA